MSKLQIIPPKKGRNLGKQGYLEMSTYTLKNDCYTSFLWLLQQITTNLVL